MADATAPLAPPAVVAFHEFEADAAWRCIEFLSDLHLSAATPHTAAAFAHYLRTTQADAVFILGDLFEAWVGDDSRFEGFEAEATAWLADAASHRTLAFMQGNRDFLVGDEFLRAVGAIALPDPSVLIAFGQRLLLSHGDALCLSDVEYQRFRKMVRDPAWQQALLAQPLAQRREIAARMRGASEQVKQVQASDACFDVDPAAAVQWMRDAGTPVLIHGHTHRPGSEPMAPGFERHVLSDWDLDHAHGKPRAEIIRWQRGGFERVPLRAAPSST